ncbi:MAG TPA: ice-binding family protein [Candidatus Eisenbacteria bacterium]|nr:ice-binding family protein [Candidatus Eisenbacteria bacterium]
MSIVGGGLAALLLLPAIGNAQSLGSAGSFAILAGTTVANTGTTIVVGSIGVSPGSGITGLAGQPISGSVHDNDATAAQAQTDLTAAYNSLAGMACGTDLSGQNLGGMTLTPGVYCFTAAAAQTGILTLDGQGNPNAVFVFQIGGTLTTAMNAFVNTANSLQNTNVYWQVGSSATLGAGTVFRGNIIALTDITLNTAATVDGRALARNGAVTMASTFVGDSSTPTMASSWGTVKVLYR